MKKIIVKATLNKDKYREVPLLLLRNDLEGLKRLVMSVVESKQRDIKEFAADHKLEQVGVEISLAPQGIYCDFVAFNRFTDVEISDRDRLEFVDLIMPEFELLDKSLQHKVIGAWEGCEITPEDLSSMYEKNYDIFESLEMLYRREGLYFDFLEKIEKNV
jgi:hypothetical protein